ncbi:MAG: YidB family protein [Burkholderiaceae bacterium]|jgi:uncharacterized protein YidB (DUF937 family)|nr:YidB family protein [Burkholderiaceae bacterium]
MLDKLISGAMQGMMGGQAQGANPLMQIVGSLLSNGGQYGGLAGLVQQFQQAGLGQQVGSWVSTGQNMPISADQLTKVFGSSQLQQMAGSAGMDVSKFSDQLASLLPQMVDQLTPNGQMPTGGVEDPMAMLSKFFNR